MRKRSRIRQWFSRPVPRPIRKAPHRFRPAVEVLEDRWVPSAPIVVNNPTDTPVVGLTDLRQAIAQANTSGGDQTIVFDSTVFNTAKTITLTGGQLELSGPPLPVKRLGGQLAEQPPVSRGQLPGVPEAPALGGREPWA
jgi:hypothetical protein